MWWKIPVNDLPGIGEVSHDLEVDEELFLDVDGADHLVQELPGVSQELLHLQVRLQLVELLHLFARQRSSSRLTQSYRKHNI